MKRIFLSFVFPVVFLLLLPASDAWAACINAAPGLGGYSCPFGNPCSPPPLSSLSICCDDPIDCPAPTPTPTPDPASPACINAAPGLGGYFCPSGNPCSPPPLSSLSICCVDPNDCPAAGPTIEPYNPECDGGAGIKSALGCIPVSAQAFTDVAMPWAIGLGAGIAFLLGIYGAFLIATASGDPERVQAGKELITSAVAGILLIIFTVILLTVIGVDILGLFSF